MADDRENLVLGPLQSTQEEQFPGAQKTSWEAPWQLLSSAHLLLLLLLQSLGKQQRGDHDSELC